VGGPLDPRELGELGIIAALRRRAGRARAPWRVGIGDDAAVLRVPAGSELVLTSDVLAEDVHFRFRTTDPTSLGHKTLAVNLSDLGAMGARPLGFLLCLGIPASTSGERLGGFIDGLLAEARSSRCPLVGGDTVEAPAWVVSVTACGEVPRGQALLRRGARPGDRLVVSGALGGAALGLWLLERDLREISGAAPFIRRQLRPRPPHRLGRRLRERGLATAAIDLSDGLSRDLGHLLRESGVGAEVDLERVPLAAGLRALCRSLGFEPLPLALHGGEDYEILFTLPKRAPPIEPLSRLLGARLTEIGTVTAARGVRYRLRGAQARVTDAGFEHFAPRSRVKRPDSPAEK
jgi:thiamine-monophosphate kinase